MRAFVVPISYSYGRALTPNDTPDADSRLSGASFIHCTGTGGIVVITQAIVQDGRAGIAPTANTTVSIYLNTGDVMAVGASFRNVNATSTTATGLVALH